MLGGILFIVGALCCARDSSQYFSWRDTFCASAVAFAVWISQRLRWRRHSAEGSRACLQAWEGACRRTRALFHVLRGAASLAKTRSRTHENHGVGICHFWSVQYTEPSNFGRFKALKMLLPFSNVENRSISLLNNPLSSGVRVLVCSF